MTDNKKTLCDWQKNWIVRWLVQLGFFFEFHVPFCILLLVNIFLLAFLFVPGLYELGVDPDKDHGVTFFGVIALLVHSLIPLMICVALSWWGFRSLLFHWNFYCSITILLVFNLILLFFFKAIFLRSMIFEQETLPLRIFYGLMWPATIAFLIALLIHLAINEKPMTEKPVDSSAK